MPLRVTVSLVPDGSTVPSTLSSSDVPPPITISVTTALQVGNVRPLRVSVSLVPEVYRDGCAAAPSCTASSSPSAETSGTTLLVDLSPSSDPSVKSPQISTPLPSSLSLPMRADGDAFVYLPASNHPPPSGGSAHSKGLFRYVGTPHHPGDGKIYFGKAVVKATLEMGLKACLPELLGNYIYRHFGCHAQTLILSDQPWRPTTSGNEAVVRSVAINHGIHLMCQWLEGFKTCSSDVLLKLQHGSPVTVTVGDKIIPLTGIGHILAVSLLVNDHDCIGSSGGNIGYTIETAVETNAPLRANAIKIDPGKSLSGFCNQTSLASVLKNIALGVVRVAPSVTISADSLSPDVKREFFETVANIIDPSCVSMESLLMRPGMEPLFTDPSSMRLYADAMNRIRQAMRDKYSGAILHGFESSLPPTTTVDCLKAIRTGYLEEVKVLDPITGDKWPIEERFVNLSLVGHSESKSPDSLHQLGRKHNRAHTRPRHRMLDHCTGEDSSIPGVRMDRNSRAEKTDVAVEDLFLKCTGSTKRVNMSGGAGVGKSTCCQIIVSHWATGRLFTEFELVVWVPLRRLTSSRYPSGDHYTVMDVIIQESLGVYPSPQLRKCVTTLYNPETTLWILDGYDEIVGRDRQVPDQLAVAFHKMMSAPNRILTGRPHAMSGLSGVLRGDVSIEVAGFKDSNIEEFVGQFARHFAVSGDVLQSQLRQSRLVWDLAHVPVNLMLLCHVFAKPETTLEESSATNLYFRVELLMGLRYCAKLGVNMTTLTEEEESRVVRPVFNWLSDIAYQAMKAGIVVIPGPSIADWLSDASETDPNMWSKLILSGFLVQADGQGDDPLSANYYFLHLTLQEYFAAKRVGAALCGGAPFPAVETEWLRTHKYGFDLEVMWGFVGGLVGCCARNEHIAGLYALADLWAAEPRDIGRVFEARVWLRMIEEGRLFDLASSVTPPIFSTVLTLARPNVTTPDGQDILKDFLEYSCGGILLNALEECPLLCEKVTLADACVKTLVSSDFDRAAWMLGKALLNFKWVWPIVGRRLQEDPIRFCESAQLLSPEILSRQEFFAALRASSFFHSSPQALQILSHPELTLTQLLECDCRAVSQWLRTLFVLYHSQRQICDLSLKLLVHVGVQELFKYPDVKDCIEEALVVDSSRSCDFAIDIVKTLGPKTLEVDWLVEWCKSRSLSHPERIVPLFAAVGAPGLDHEWLLVAVQNCLARGLSCSVAVVSSMMPFILRHRDPQSLLKDWLCAMSESTCQWRDLDFDMLYSALKSSPLPLLEVDDARTMMRTCCSSEPTAMLTSPMIPRISSVALMAACGPALLRYDWYTDWLARAVGDKSMSAYAMRSLRGMGCALLTCDQAVRLLKVAVDVGNIPESRVTIAALCEDAKFRQHPTVVAWLREKVVSKEIHPHIRRLYFSTGVPVVVDPAEAATVSAVQASVGHGGYVGDIVAMFPRLPHGRGVLHNVALDPRVLREAMKHVCISFYSNLLVVESPAGRFEHQLTGDNIKFMRERLRRLPDGSDAFKARLQTALQLAARVGQRFGDPIPASSGKALNCGCSAPCAIQ